MFEHIFLTLTCTGIPTLVLWTIKKDILLEKIKLFPKLLIFTIPYAIIADNIAIAMGAWSYNPDKITGIFIGLMPIDDLVFFIACQFGLFSLIVVVKDHLRLGSKNV